MALHGTATWLLAAVAILAVALTVPYTLTAIDYRRRDNGLAYLLFVSGVGVWNALFVAQLLTADRLVQGFFLALSIVGAVLAGLGWFLFAATASSTDTVLDSRRVYGVISVAGGLDIALAVTAPVHPLYWSLDPVAGPLGFAAIEPAIGYWLHTGFLAALFGAGAALFHRSWRLQPAPYPRAYAAAGAATVTAIAGSAVLAPGGLGVGGLAAAGLATVGWVQASRGQVIDRLLARG